MNNSAKYNRAFVRIRVCAFMLLTMMVVSVPVIGGQASVSLWFDVCPTVWDGKPTAVNVFISNDTKVRVMQLGFRIYSPDGVTWTWDFQPDGYGPSRYVTVEPGGRINPGNLVWEATGLMVDETRLPDTIFLAGQSDTGGMAPGPSQRMMSLHLTPHAPEVTHAGTICIDSASVLPDGKWLFIDAATGDTIVPVFEGPMCFPVQVEPGCCPYIWSGSYSINTNHCTTGTASASIVSPDQWSQVQFEAPVIVGGGGTVSLEGQSYATLRYTPVPSDVGKNITIRVPFKCSCHYVCNYWEVAVTVTGQVPILNAGASYDALTLNKHFVKTDIAVSNTDPCDDLTYSLVAGIGAIDPVTGIYTLETQPEQVGVHEIIVAVTDDTESVQDTFTVQIQDLPDWPGNANCSGGVDIGDAVFLVNYIFRGGPRPPIINWADANNDCTVNVGDAVYLVNYIFRSGPAPQPGCAE